MDELSESFKNLQRRKDSEKERNKKAREKIYRALIGIIPGANSLVDISLSLVDANREQMIDDAIELLERKIGKQQIKILETISDINTLKLKLEEICVDIDKIKEEYLTVFKTANYYGSDEIKSVIITLVQYSEKTLVNSEIIKNEQKKQSEQLDDIQKMMRSLNSKLGEDTTSLEVIRSNINEQYDDEVLVKIGEQVIPRVNELIEQNEFNLAHSILDGIISTKGFNELPDELRIGILATKGNIYIKQLDKQNAKPIYHQLNNIVLENKRKWNFIFSYGTLLGSEDLVEEALEKLKRLGLSDKEIKIKKSTFLLASGKAEDIIKLLGGSNGNN